MRERLTPLTDNAPCSTHDQAGEQGWLQELNVSWQRPSSPRLRVIRSPKMRNQAYPWGRWECTGTCQPTRRRNSEGNGAWAGVLSFRSTRIVAQVRDTIVYDLAESAQLFRSVVHATAASILLHEVPWCMNRNDPLVACFPKRLEKMVVGIHYRLQYDQSIGCEDATFGIMQRTVAQLRPSGYLVNPLNLAARTTAGPLSPYHP